MKDKMVCFRVDPLTLEEAKKIIVGEGKTISSVLNSYLSEIVRHGGSSFSSISNSPISMKDTYPSGYFSFLNELEKGEFENLDLQSPDAAPEDINL